jgi:tetratricopeptide (TPR) repeat protein
VARALKFRIALPLAVAAGCLLAVSLLSPAPARQTEEDRAPAPASVVSPPPASSKLADLTLEGLQQSFLNGDAAKMTALAKRLQQATTDDAERLHHWLHRRTGVGAEAYKNVLRAIGAAVPNKLGRFSTSDKEFDWLEALIKLPDRKLGSPSLRRARAEAALSVALARALAVSRHPEAALSLLRFAYRHQGAFRDEAGRQIRALGPHAVPGLLRAAALKDAEAHKMVRYAAYQLDRIDCARPDRALRQADPDLRVEILHAYGETRSPAAVSAVLSYSNDTVEAVRRAARWAMLRYVSGRPPKVVKRKIKLPGGKVSDKERALYLTYRQLASHALLDRLTTDLTGLSEGKKYVAEKKTLAEEAEPRYLAERLFARFDERREEAHREEFRSALQLAEKGDLDGALARLDRILAVEPYHGQRGAMAPLYFNRGRNALAAGRLEEAQTYFTKAVHLDPGAEFVREAKARRSLAEALADRSMSTESEWKLRAALRQEPGLRQATLALAAYERRQQLRLWWASGIGGGIALSLIFGLTLLRRRVSW